MHGGLTIPALEAPFGRIRRDLAADEFVAAEENAYRWPLWAAKAEALATAAEMAKPVR